MPCTGGPLHHGCACPGACPGAPPGLTLPFWYSGRPGRGLPLPPCLWRDAPPGRASRPAPSC
eukprot:13100286-Ditylum_brightwellii.AAC.1